ncbi:MAG: SDR family NAD(P)-dependent oxidoreductase [Gammaproteobacteria bacterium]|nr:SDR family NAD(P)-dependent oxidoreductase [Gammaproteobacteria bacterium]
MPRALSKTAKHVWVLLTPKPMAEKVDISGRNIIVTGARPYSLGYETAKILASWGASVVATSRHAAQAEKSLKDDLCKIGVNENNIAVRPLDLCDVDSVNGFATWYGENYGDKLHALVNNAGILKDVLQPWKKMPLTEDGFEIHWRINYLGSFHLTHLLLPLLKQTGLESGDARIVNVSSHLHDQGKNEDLFNDEKTYHSLSAYGRSKLAMIHFSREIERRFAQEYNLHSMAVHPGSVDTNMTRLEIPEGRIGDIWKRVGSALAPLIMLHRTHGAQTTVMCASQSPLQGGQYYVRCKAEEPTDACKDEAVSRRLWDKSEAWVETLKKPDGGEHEQI